MKIKSKAEMMKRLRKERKEDGMFEFRIWVTAEQKELLEDYIEELLKIDREAL